MNNSYISLINKNLIIFFPIILVSGAFLTDLIGTYIAVTTTVYLVLNKKYFIFKNSYFYFFIIVFFFINLSSYFSEFQFTAFKSSITYLRLILFVFSIALIFNLFSDIAFKLYWVFYLMISLLILDSILIVFFNLNIFGNEIIENNRIKSLFGDEGVLGSYVSRLLPMFIGLSYFAKLKKQNILNYVLIFFSAILILFSGERTAFMNFLIFIIFFILIDRKKIIKTFLILIFTGLLVFIINSQSLKRIFVHTIFQLQNKDLILFQKNNNDEKNLIIFSLRHTLHYYTALQIFKDNPIIGGGIKSFRYLCSNKKYEKIIEEKYHLNNYKNFEYNNGCNTHPHHIYLQFLSETGIIGFVLFLSIFLYVVYQLFVLIKRNFKLCSISRGDYFILVAIFISMFPFLPSGNYFNNWFIFINYFPIGFYLANKINR